MYSKSTVEAGRFGPSSFYFFTVPLEVGSQSCESNTLLYFLDNPFITSPLCCSDSWLTSLCSLDLGLEPLWGILLLIAYAVHLVVGFSILPKLQVKWGTTSLI